MFTEKHGLGFGLIYLSQKYPKLKSKIEFPKLVKFAFSGYVCPLVSWHKITAILSFNDDGVFFQF